MQDRLGRTVHAGCPELYWDLLYVRGVYILGMPHPRPFVRVPPGFDLPPGVPRSMEEHVLEIRQSSPTAPREVYAHPMLLPAGAAGAARRRDRRPSTRGGAVLSTGHDGTVVYSLGDLVRVNPGVQTACLETVDGGCEPLQPPMAALDAALVVKQIRRSALLARYEHDRTRIIRELFSRDVRLLGLTMLHPHYVGVQMTVLVRPPPSPNDYGKGGTHAPEFSGLPVHASHVAYRRMDACLGDKGIQRALSVADIVVMLRVVLRFLDRLHDGGYLHMDIKPHNIGVLWEGRGATRRRAFTVGDYGLVSSISSVHACLARRGSYHSGTNGFMSPLLLHPEDEAQNRTYPKFVAVATASEEDTGAVDQGGGKGAVDRGMWDAYFGRYKRALVARGGRGYAKVDLHSTGLMLYELLRSNKGTIRTKDEGARRYLSHDFLPRLLFFRKGDFQSAAHALGALDAPDAPPDVRGAIAEG